MISKSKKGNPIIGRKIKKREGKIFLRVPNIIKLEQMENCKASELMTKKSLMNALENLERKANNLIGLANFSDQVVDKLNNPRSQPEPTDECMDKKGCANRPIPDLIDLFNEVVNKLEVATNRIETNTERINSIIE